MDATINIGLNAKVNTLILLGPHVKEFALTMSNNIEDEIREAAEDVCYPDWDRDDSIIELREGLKSLQYHSAAESLSDSVFSGVSCFELPKVARNVKFAYSDSPIRKKLKDNKFDDLSDDNDDDEVLSKFPKEEKLVNEAYNLIYQVYEDCNDIDQKLQQVSHYFKDDSDISFEKENNIFVPDEVSVQPNQRINLEKSRHPFKEIVPSADPCLRKVLCPEPGRPILRHDPVKKMQIYKEEWKRLPTPEEQKRLELRWKVREHMLRRDFPKKFPSGGHAHHPKDWSPKPYMN